MDLKLFLRFTSPLLLALASLFVVFSLESDVASIPVSDLVYDIVSDVNPIAVPTTGTQFRFNNGKWQQYSPSLGWYDMTNPVSLAYMLNQLGVATVADIATGTNDYFGSPGWPVTVPVRNHGGNGWVQTTYNSLSAELGGFLTSYGYNNVIGPGTGYLFADGTVVQAASNIGQVAVFRHGLMGLGWLLGGAGAPSHTYLTSSGGSDSSSGSYLSSLTQGQLGLATLLKYSNSTLSSFSSSNHSDIRSLNNDLWAGYGVDVVSTRYDVGGNANGVSQTWQSMGHLQSQMLSNLNRSLVSYHSYLDTDGSTNLNSGQTMRATSDILADGFVGLSTILRGNSTGDVLTFDYTRRNYVDNTVSTLTFDNLFQTILTPLDDIQNDLASFLFSHGTDLDIEIRDNMTDQADQFVDDFTSPGGQGTPSAGQIGDTAGVSGSLKDSFSGSSTPADAFSQISDSGNYSFFSSQVQQELNPFYSSRSYSFDDGDDIIDFVTPKLQEIFNGVGSSW